MIDQTINLLVNFIDQIGYLGIFIGMFLESTMFPLPSEAIMIPAGMSAAYGKMNLYLVIFYGVLGNVAGAIFSYYLADHLGRPVLFKIGKYFFVKPESIVKIEKFFKNHGNISVFIGRLIPGLRHFISLPAGVAKMDMKLFCFYTTIGSAIWTSILTILGFLIGTNKDLIKKYLHLVIIASIAICSLIIAIYAFLKRKNSDK
ncbi:MAG: DedA family protein [Pelagibacterales bacterium]|nr:DedA family protein [Pelagibacterales bacterium]